MEQQTFNKFIALLEKGTHYTFEELKAQDHGEAFYRFPTLNGYTHVQLTKMNGSMVLLVYHFKDGVYNSIVTVPVTKLEMHTDQDKRGYTYRYLFRVNDSFEIMDEVSGNQKFFCASFDKGGFPTQNKKFELQDI